MPVSASERFERFFAASSDCQFYVKKDDDGRFRYVHVNPAALAVTGRQREQELIGLTPTEALGEDYGNIVEHNISKVFEHGLPYHFIGALGKDGRGPIYDADYIPLTDDSGEIAGVLGNARDITAISKLNENMLHAQRLEALGELSASIVHDFKNILTVFQSALIILSNKEISADRRAVVFQEAEKALENGTALTQRLTSFARKEPLRSVPHEVNELISSCLFMMQRTLGKKIILEFNFDPTLWRACCDRNEFEIAMMNLAANARDAIEGRGSVIITAKNQVRSKFDPAHYPAEYIEIAVRDSGCGMPPDVVSKATNPFFSTKSDGKGTGLGLSSIAKFVSDVGGALRIESAVGQGTTVSLLLRREAL